MSATMSPSSSPTPTRRRATPPRRSTSHYTELPAVVDPAKAADARPADNSRRRAGQHRLQLASRRQGGDRRGLRVRGACDEARPRQQPPDPERDGAARGGRRLRFGHGHDDALHDQPEPARRAPRALGLHRPRARAQAARHRAGRRRRLRLQDLHLRRGDRVRLGGQEDRSPGQMDGRPHGVLPLRRARPRSRDPRRDWRSTPAARSPACACTRSPTWAPICRRSPRRCRPISMRRCCRASTTSQRSTPRSTRSTPRPRRSTPIAAPAGRRRPSSSSAWSKSRRARPGATRPSSVGRISSPQFPHQTPVIMTYDAGDYAAALDKALALADYKGVGGAQGGLGRQGQAARRRLLRLHRGLRPRALAPRSARSARASGCWESAEVRVNPIGTVEVLTGSHSHGQGHETTFAQLVSDRLGIPIDNVSIVHGDTDKVQMGMGTYGSRSGAVGMSAIFKALDKIEAKAKKVAGHVLEAVRKRHRVQGRQVHGQGHRQVDRLRLASRCRPISRTSSTARSSSPA